MRAPTNGECNCGNPGIVAGVSRVRIERGAIVGCQECRPELNDEKDEPPKGQEELHSIRVRIISRKYAKPDGTFFIYVVALDAQAEDWMPSFEGKTFSLCGPVGALNQGDVVLVTGKFSSNPKYGMQFDAVSEAQLAIKESEAGLRAFLARFPQIGTVRAEQLLRRLGGMKAVLDALDNDPMRLTIVDGITVDRALEIKEAYDREAGFREFRMWASTHGMTERIIAAAIEEWGDEARAVIEADPFVLMLFPRVSFKVADEVHLKLGGALKHPRRCAAGVLAAIEGSTDEGHTFVEQAALTGEAKGVDGATGANAIANKMWGRSRRASEEIQRLALTPEEVVKGLEILETEYTRVKRTGQKIIEPPKIVREEGLIYLRELYNAETSIARELTRIASANVPTYDVPANAWGDMTPAPEQVEALRLACSLPVVVITGSPGTGKSAITRVILDVLEAAGNRSVLCAPTGKAAKRLSELSGRPASTIHKLISHHKTSSDRFVLPESVVLLDEASMASVDVAAPLFAAVRTGARLIIVGDVDQLPSVGPGQLLADTIDSGVVPVVRLTRIFRQKSDGQERRIPQVARDVNEGRCPDVNLKGTDVVFLPFDDTALMQEKIVTAVTKQIPEKYGIPPEQIQVISPQKGELGKKNWEVGVRALNSVLQDALNPKLDAEVFIGEGYTARPNDRVIHCKNNYQLGVRNGEQGVVVRCSTTPFVPNPDVVTSSRLKEGASGDAEARPMRAAKERANIVLVVDFGDQVVGYTKDECRELQLSYALTCHKMQGAQSAAVVIPVHDTHSWMWSRRLLYTAITRAERYVLLLGQERMIARAVKNIRGAERNTSLCLRLREALTNVEV